MVSISQLPPVSPQLLARTVIGVQNLDFRFSYQQFLAFILVSIFNFLPLFHQFSAVTWFQYLHIPPFLSIPSYMHLVSMSNFPPIFFIKFPKFPVFIGFQYLYFSHSLPIISCIHLILISKFPSRYPEQLPAFILLHIPGALGQFPAFIWFYIWFHSGLLKFHPPVSFHSFPYSHGFNISIPPCFSTVSLHAPYWDSKSRFPFLVLIISCIHPCFDL